MVKRERRKHSRKLTAEHGLLSLVQFASPSESQMKEWESVQGAPGSHL